MTILMEPASSSHPISHSVHGFWTPICALLGSLIGSFIGVIMVLVPLSSPPPTYANIVVHSGTSSIPLGSVEVGAFVAMYDSTQLGDDWLLCDGREVEQASYPALYGILRASTIDRRVVLPDYRGMKFVGSPAAWGRLEGTKTRAAGEAAADVSFWVRGR